MGNRDLPDIYAHALGPAALGLGHIYQANPSCPCYNYYIYSDKVDIHCVYNYSKVDTFDKLNGYFIQCVL